MNLKPAWGAAALLGLCLAGCASDPERINSTNMSVSYQYEGDDLKVVTKKAGDYCAEKGGVATLRTVSESQGKSVAIFDCA